jgi:hypothetical protein
MTAMLNLCIDFASKRVDQWKQVHGVNKEEFYLIRQPSDLVVDVVLVCVFGMSSINEKITFIEKGQKKEYSIS